MKARILNFLGERFEAIETISVLTLASSLLLSSIGLESVDPLVILAAGVLAINYYFFAFQPMKADSHNALSLFAHKLTYVGLSVAVLAFLFEIRAWDMSGPMTVAAIGAMLISFALSYILKANSSRKQDVNLRHFIRCVA